MADALLGAVSGAFASWLMERLQYQLAKIGSPEALRREEETQRAGDGEPATVKVAERVAHLLGVNVPEDKKPLAGELVHYATGAFWGAILGAFHRELRGNPLVVGGLFGAWVWLFQDELMTPLLRLARGPTAYPASLHAKALAAHLAYGEATASTLKLLSRARA